MKSKQNISPQTFIIFYVATSIEANVNPKIETATNYVNENLKVRYAAEIEQRIVPEILEHVPHFQMCLELFRQFAIGSIYQGRYNNLSSKQVLVQQCPPRCASGMPYRCPEALQQFDCIQ